MAYLGVDLLPVAVDEQPLRRTSWWSQHERAMTEANWRELDMQWDTSPPHIE